MVLLHLRIPLFFCFFIWPVRMFKVELIAFSVFFFLFICLFSKKIMHPQSEKNGENAIKIGAFFHKNVVNPDGI